MRVAWPPRRAIDGDWRRACLVRAYLIVPERLDVGCCFATLSNNATRVAIVVEQARPKEMNGAAAADLSLVSLLAFARKLQNTSSFEELLAAARTEVERATAYRHAWLMVKDDESDRRLRLIDASGGHRASIWEVAPVLEVTGDAFLETLLASDGPVVIEDARIDPRTNKNMVERLQNRTLINIPMTLLDAPFGLFGVRSEEHTSE